MRAASEEKWLESHGIEHWTEFYTDYGVALQKKFFGHFLKGEDTGWKDQPRGAASDSPPRREVRGTRGERVAHRAHELGRSCISHAEGHLLGEAAPEQADSATYAGLGDGVTFVSPPLKRETEITGPLASKLWVSSATGDADLFLVLRLFTPDFREVTFQGRARPPHLRWPRAGSGPPHRKLDEALTLPYRPYHAHDEIQPLTPGEIYELDVEIWPTCIVAPRGYRLALSIRGCDYVYPWAASPGGFRTCPPSSRAWGRSGTTIRSTGRPRCSAAR